MDTIQNDNYVNVAVVPKDKKSTTVKQTYEFLIDRVTHEMFQVKPDNTLFNITEDMKETLKHIKASDINVTIGGSETTLEILLNQITEEGKTTVRAFSMGDDIKYVNKAGTFDGNSIQLKRNVAQINGFDSAEDKTIPMKQNGKLVWLPLVSSDDGSVKDTTGNLDPGSEGGANPSTGNGEIIQPGQPEDGLQLKCRILAPVDHKMYLLASRRQKTIDPEEFFEVVLPLTTDQKCDVEWMLQIKYSDQIYLRWHDNIWWENGSPDLEAHTMYEFMFKTWDGGLTWGGSWKKYKNPNIGISASSDMSDLDGDE